MKSCGNCYYRDSTWSLQHRELSARCDHDSAPEDNLLELRISPDSHISPPYWCPVVKEKFEISSQLKNASLEQVCDMADSLVKEIKGRPGAVESVLAFDISYMLEYLRLNYDLVEKKK